MTTTIEPGTVLAEVSALLPDLRGVAKNLVAVDAALSTKSRGTPAERTLARLMRKPIAGSPGSNTHRRWAAVHVAILIALAELCEPTNEEGAAPAAGGGT